MKVRSFLPLWIVVPVLLSGVAFAQIAVTPGAVSPIVTPGAPVLVPVGTVSAAPLVAFIQPYVTMVFESLLAALAAYVVALVKTKFGVIIQNADVERVKSLARTYVGGEFAKADAGISAKQFDLGSKIVADVYATMAERAPDLLKRAGLDPLGVQHIVLGEIGKLQATSSTVTNVTNVAAPSVVNLPPEKK